MQAMLAEFKLDYNQRHFVRNETFKNAAEGITVGRACISGTSPESMAGCVHVRSRLRSYDTDGLLIAPASAGLAPSFHEAAHPRNRPTTP